MKRKLRLLLAMVLAMTMVMGISVTAFAAPAGTSMDEQNECPTHQGTAGDGVEHLYSLGTTFEYCGGLCVDCIVYDPIDGPVRLDESKAVEWNKPADAFANGEYSEGWYYGSASTGWLLYPCVAFDSVDIDLSSVRAGATFLDISSSVANSITTYPEDTIDIISMVLSPGSSDFEFLMPTDPLEKGKTYTLWLTLQSAGVLFKQDSVSDYALSNLNIDAAYKNVLHDDSIADEGTILDMQIRFTVDSSTPGPGPNPNPKPAPKKEPESKGMDAGYMAYLMNQIKTDDAKKKVPAKAEPDRDTFKSEAPSKTVMSTDTMGADKFLDLKVHAADERTKLNQQFLCNALVRPNAQILLTENVYSRRDLSIAENGSLQTLTWNNLPKNQAGPVYGVVYNQIDGAYEINGILDANGTATFTGFKLRPASTIKICK